MNRFKLSATPAPYCPKTRSPSQSEFFTDLERQRANIWSTKGERKQRRGAFFWKTKTNVLIILTCATNIQRAREH